MAGFRIRETGEYLMTRYALEQYRYGKGGVPEEITDTWLDSIGMDAVFEGPQAIPTDHYGFSQFAGLEQTDNKWFTKYIVGPVFVDDENSTAAQKEAEYKAMKDEEQAKSVRQTRNTTLSQSDWTQLDDTPLTNAKKLEWAEYRQALRDLPAQAGFPWTMQWPTQPE